MKYHAPEDENSWAILYDDTERFTIVNYNGVLIKHDDVDVSDVYMKTRFYRKISKKEWDKILSNWKIASL